MDDETYYVPGQDDTIGRKNRFFEWLRLTFRKRKVIYGGGFLLSALASWWTGNFGPALVYIMVFWGGRKIISLLRKVAYSYVIECRMQGEIIRHCSYYRQPIKVPMSWIRIYRFPHSRFQDVISYGDSKPPVATHNIIVCDYFEEKDNGDILMVFAEDSNFSNFALYGRINSDLEQAMISAGEERQTMEDMKDVATEMYRKGTLGRTPDESVRKLRHIIGKANSVEKKFNDNGVAKRSVWLRYKYEVPRMRKQMEMLLLDLPRLATAEASKLFHIASGHPMSEEQYKKITALGKETENIDFEERVRALVRVEDGDVHKSRKALTDDEATLVPGR